MANEVNDNRHEPSAVEIETALSKTGYLLEHRVAKILRNHNPKPEVTIGAAYPDPESGKSREIDVLAEFYEAVERKPDISVMVTITLIIECKNNSSPFVLIGDHGQESPWPRDLMVISFDPFALGFSNKKYSKIEYEAKLNRIPGLPSGKDFTGRQLLRLNRQGGDWKADNNAIYDSILYPLAKASQFHMDYLEREAEDNPEEHWQYPGIRIILPVVVTSGPIYTVDATDDDLKIVAAKWASIKRTFHSEGLDRDFWADIVSFPEWKGYLSQKIVEMFTGLQASMTKHIHFYDPEWMAANFGEPTDNEFYQMWLRRHQAHRKNQK